MSTSRHIARLPLTAACLVALSVTGVGAASSRPADLQGVWTLNRDRSDANEDRDRGNPRPGSIGSAPGIGSAGPMSGAGIQGPLMGGRKVDPVLAEHMRELARIAFEAPEQLAITEEGAALRLVGDGRMTRLTPDGSKTEELNGTLVVERRTRWEKDRLITEVKAKGGGGEVKQVYTREGDRLTVESTFEGEVAARAEKMKFVYDLQEK